MTARQLVVGTRSSQMALAQTKHVIQALEQAHPGITITVREITTKGDVDQRPIPLDTIGKAWFTKEIEQALLDKTIDFAVHSLKDVPPQLPPGLSVFSVLPRDDPRDALIAGDFTVETLKKGAVIGTDSLRRKVLLHNLRPDLVVKSVRGNANTRLHKLDTEGYDALIMAAAGMKRIGTEQRISQYLDPTIFVPAPGQGALAIEARTDHHELLNLLRVIQDYETEQATAAEQAFVATIGGGCKLPVSCYAKFTGQSVQIYGMVGSIDGRQCVIDSRSGPANSASNLAVELAIQLAKQPFVDSYANAS